MKITKIECFPISLPRHPPSTRVSKIVLIKIYTDEGIVGVAEAGEYINTSADQDIVMLMIKSWNPS